MRQSVSLRAQLQSPVSPISQKLSFLSKGSTWSAGRYCSLRDKEQSHFLNYLA